VPVFGDPVLDYRSLRLGETIRQLRKHKGWMMRTLASRLSISVASLSAIENDKAVLDVERLVAVADALGVRPDVLFPRSRSCHYHVVRRSTLESIPAVPLKATDRTGATSTVGHNLIRPLAAPFVGKHVEPFHITVLPAADSEVQLVSHHHEEFFFVLRERVELRLKTPDGLVVDTLGAGDCAYFRSYLPHCLRSAGSSPAEAVHVLYTGYGATDSEQGHPTMSFRDRPGQDAFAEQVALKITALRQSDGVSVSELASDLKIGVRRLTEIERGRRPVSIELLLGVCRRFRKPLEYFLASTLTERPFYFFQRASDISQLPVRKRRRLVDRGWAESEYRSLAAGFGPRGMYPYYAKLRYPPGAVPSLHEHHGQEFVYVLNGEVTLMTLVEEERVSQRLSAGDVCFIDSTVPHRFLGMGLSPYDDSRAEVVDVYWCPLGESYLFAEDLTAVEEAASAASAAEAPLGSS
jgi:transcriptional regulator with XRE-family HTH domain